MKKIIKQEVFKKPFTQGCKLWHGKRQLEEGFETMLFEFVWFSHKLYQIVPHTGDFLPIKFFPIVTLKTLAWNDVQD